MKEKEIDSFDHLDGKGLSLSENEKEKLLKELYEKKNIEDSVKIFSDVMDTYGVDVLVSVVPVLGDTGSSLVSTLFLFYQARRMHLPFGSILKILGYQIVDAAIGSTSIPFISDFADYLFKANKWSYAEFNKYFEILKTEALKKGVSDEEITLVEGKNKKFMDIAHKFFKRK